MTEYRDGWPYPVAFPPHEPEDDAGRGDRRGAASASSTSPRPRSTRTSPTSSTAAARRSGTGEERCLVDSPRDVPTYDHKPRDERRRRRRGVQRALGRGRLPLRDHQLRQPRHGRPHRCASRPRSRRSRTVDRCLGEVVAAVHEKGGACIVTADHGNCEQMLEPDGSPNTAHSTNPVPLIVTVPGVELREGGILADVAPTVLALLGIAQPEAMTGPLPARAKATELYAWPVRHDPARLSFEIQARDGEARTGLIHTGHGQVATPAFIPLATKGSVRGLSSAEVAGLGYEMVLGNTFHLHLAPGERADRRARRPAPVHGLGAGAHHATRAASRSSRSPTAASPTRSRDAGASGAGGGARSRSPSRGWRFRSLLDGSEPLPRAGGLDGIQAALGSDIALAFDECTPFHADRDYTARSTERTQRWLDRCLAWHEREGAGRPGGLRDRPGRGLRGSAAGIGGGGLGRAAVDGIAIGGTPGPRQGGDARRARDHVPHLPDEAPRHLLGIGEVDDLLRGIGIGHRPLDCAVPTRLARHGAALAPKPDTRFRLDLAKGALRERRVADRRGLPVRGLPPPLPRLPPPPRARNRT